MARNEGGAREGGGLDARVAVLMGEAVRLSRGGDAETAAKALRAALELSPEDAAALDRLGRALRACGRIGGAPQAHPRSLRRARMRALPGAGARGSSEGIVAAIGRLLRRRKGGGA